MSEFMKNLVKQNKEAMKKEAATFKKEFKKKEDAAKEISNWIAVKPIVEAHIKEQIKMFPKNPEKRSLYEDEDGAVITCLVTKDDGKPNLNSTGEGYNWWVRSIVLEKDLLCFADNMKLFGNVGLGIWVRGWATTKYKMLGDSCNPMFPKAFNEKYGKYPNQYDISEIEVFTTINIWQRLEMVVP